MQISTIVTMNDLTHFTGTAGPVGIARFFDVLTLARVKRVYWRVFSGGMALYPSEITNIFRGKDIKAWHGLGDGGGPKTENWAMHEDYSTWDPLATAVEMAHERGIELCAWWTVCEEDHGGHVGSAFGKRTELRMHDRDGHDYPGTVELFLPEVQDYRMSVLEEIKQRGVDGLLLDFARCNATPGADPDGIHRFGYNPPVREAFKAGHGSDPLDLPKDDADWLAFKNDYRAGFVETIRDRIGKDKHVALMTIPHVQLDRWLCLDLARLTGNQTIDLVMPFSMTYCNSPEATVRDVKSLREQSSGEHAIIAAGMQGYWGMIPDVYEASIAAAESIGTPEMVLYEGCMFERMKLLTPTRAWHMGVPRRDRSFDLPVAESGDGPPVSVEPGDQAFYIVAGPDRPASDAATGFSIQAGATSLKVQVRCLGDQEEFSPVVAKEKQEFLRWIAPRNTWQRSDKVHVYLDPGATRLHHRHFTIERDGSAWAEQRYLSPWEVSWTSSAETVDDQCWVATFEIPYAILDTTPAAGDTWGFQIVREHCAGSEVASWFVSTAYGVDPMEWGDLRFTNPTA